MNRLTKVTNKLNSIKSNIDKDIDRSDYCDLKINKTRLNERYNKKITHKKNGKVKNVKNAILGNTSSYNYKYTPPSNAKEAGTETLKEKILKLRKNKLKLPDIDIKLDRLKNKIKVPSIKKPDIINNDIKNAVLGASKKISDKIERCYDLTMHQAGLFDLRYESLIGVDITPNCIYLCQIDALNGKRVLTSLTSVCMEGKFLTQDIAEYSDQYAQSLKELANESNVKTKNVALSIPVSNSIVKTVTIPALKDKEIEKALKYGSLWNNIMNRDSKPEDYSIFYQVIRRNKASKSMDVLFVATRLSDVDIYTDVVKKSGLNPVIVDVRSFAISNAFNHKLSNNDASDTSVFLEFGLEENYAMLINSGMASIKQINVREIHRIALIEDNLDDELISEFASDYSSQVRRIINKYQNKHEAGHISTLFVLSAVPQVTHIINKLSDLMTEYSIVECNFFDCMKINDDFTISGVSAKQNLSSWAAAIGTALRNIDIFGNGTANKTYPNMLPDAGRYAYVKRTNYGLNSVAMVATIAITFIATTLTLELDKQSKNLSKELAKFDGVQEKYSSIVNDYNEIHKENRKINSMIALMRDAGESQQRILSVYKYLNLVILDDVWLREIKFSAPDKIEITGGSDNDRSILEFMQLLNEGNQFSKVSLKGMKEIREISLHHADVVNVKTFKLESTLSDIPVYDFHDINKVAGGRNSGS
ncbi:MAG: hypothetical protein COV35_03870 [Alphaproteobacteria bacterium CG11_big_fil_rev_8_21_14_0_20_39_49]|nr:MAG: hypothetical protein COV35_03870 [Alphaproteobacteria bacterium CG11_big_fil_rev_8_21_14_0_20_39_49]